METTNLFTEAPFNPDSEYLDRILEKPGLKLERIVSHGHRTPDGEWYDQAADEWVVLLSGAATLLFEKDNQLIEMNPGDHILIPAHCRHRVERTEENRESVWLALHVTS
ncbi:cupin domain-containing protein [Sansalvadorimonas sp. 2012CJ34-2]|uniref:Cupin domain-containing protein n=1 Tax=Parendozoicomonas callyspongiae TaxID=2942213 RepID=A0ABT0PCR6_9GAMM|nr:cupin domain-containing protein [Sansalvadorimonas sp. 2012CJ34-2]MCL6269093.1 cupin domain-containing protein [Sansalvadorimonas sp. 2012CJ34-2]